MRSRFHWERGFLNALSDAYLLRWSSEDAQNLPYQTNVPALCFFSINFFPEGLSPSSFDVQPPLNITFHFTPSPLGFSFTLLLNQELLSIFNTHSTHGYNYLHFLIFKSYRLAIQIRP